jgi:hypothetical protein
MGSLMNKVFCETQKEEATTMVAGCTGY